MESMRCLRNIHVADFAASPLRHGIPLLSQKLFYGVQIEMKNHLFGRSYRFCPPKKSLVTYTPAINSYFYIESAMQQ